MRSSFKSSRVFDSISIIIQILALRYRLYQNTMGKWKAKSKLAVKSESNLNQKKTLAIQSQNNVKGNIQSQKKENLNVGESLKKTSKYSALQEKFKKKLEGARFRVINEQLYTCKGNEAFDSFQKDNSLFSVVYFIYLFIIMFSIMKDLENK